MAFSCGRTCVLVVVLILTAFVFVAMSCGHRELFVYDEIMTGTTMKSDTLAEKDKTYKYIDDEDKGVCYPSEYKKRSVQSGEEPCTSYRFQNPAYHKNQIFLGNGSSTNPLSLVEFSNGETLENAILSEHVKEKVEGLLTKQDRNYDELVRHNENFKNGLTDARTLNKEITPVDDYTVKTLDSVIKGTPSSTAVPSLSGGGTVSPCSDDKCKYIPFKYTTTEYGPIGNNIDNVKTPGPNSSQAMYISNVQSPNLIQFQDQCPL